MCACYLLCRHSNGSAEDHNDDGDDHADDGGSLSRSGSEDNVAQIQNGHNNNNNGYTHKSMLKKKKKNSFRAFAIHFLYANSLNCFIPFL